MLIKAHSGVCHEHPTFIPLSIFSLCLPYYWLFHFQCRELWFVPFEVRPTRLHQPTEYYLTVQFPLFTGEKKD